MLQRLYSIDMYSLQKNMVLEPFEITGGGKNKKTEPKSIKENRNITAVKETFKLFIISILINQRGRNRQVTVASCQLQWHRWRGNPGAFFFIFFFLTASCNINMPIFSSYLYVVVYLKVAVCVFFCIYFIVFYEPPNIHNLALVGVYTV